MSYLLQIDWGVVNAAFAKYGIWGVLALLALLFFYKRVWPKIETSWDESRRAKLARAELADKVLLDNAEQNRKMMDTTIREFADALRASNRESRSVVSQLQALTTETKKQNEHLEALTDEVRKR